MKLLTYANLLIFILFIIFPKNIIAQESKSGVITNEIRTSDEIVKILLPKHLPKGKTISGTVTEEPLSNSTKDLKRFNKRGKLALKFGDISITNNGVFSVTMPEDENVLLSIRDNKGKIISETNLHTEPPVNHQQFNLPGVVRKDYPEKITGDFSGNITNASVKIDEKPANILAGNESELFFETNDAEPGKSTIFVEYEQIEEKQEINVVDYSIQADKTSLNRGESTQLKVNVVGLKDLQEPLTFAINNQSERTVSLEGGNTQTIRISPEEVSETGTWDRQFQIQSLARGTFSISTSLEVPSATEPQNSNNVVSCNLEDIPVLLTAEQCDKFNEKLDNYPPVENPYFTDKSEIPDVNFYEGKF